MKTRKGSGSNFDDIIKLLDKEDDVPIPVISLTDEQCELLINIICVWDDLINLHHDIMRDSIKRIIINHSYKESDKIILNSVRQSYKRYLNQPKTISTDKLPDAITAIAEAEVEMTRIMGIPKKRQGTRNNTSTRFSELLDIKY